MKLFSLALLLSCGLWAQEAAKAPLAPCHNDGRAEICLSPEQKELADAKARIAWLEQKLAATEAKMAALMQFYSANDALTGLAAKEPKAK